MVSDRVKAWQDSKIGLMSVSCKVTRNGQPLTGAEVQFLPEKFLGDAMKIGKGTTNQNGTATLTVPKEPGSDLPPGVAPGIYRVEITKAGDNIPARYNSATILGQEISNDNRDLQMGITYSLKY